MAVGATARVAIGVGGTFTDLVSLEADAGSGAQTLCVAKTDTTPPGFEVGVLRVLEKSGVDPALVRQMAHGTTVVINALTERKGARTGLITTEGFRDVLEIARGDRPDFFNLRYRKPEPFVPRRLRRELAGRMTYRGDERAPLDLKGLAAIVEDFKAEGVEAVAVCFLHAFANPDHEARLVAAIRQAWPAASVVASHQITREWREYERTNTTVLSAYVQPLAERYLDRLESGLRDKGFAGSLHVMQSNCGVETVAASKAIPITMVESGPASGVWGAAALGRLIGEPNVLALDIGGTTAKCSLIEDGEVRIVSDYWMERTERSAGYPIMVPVVDIVEIGQGGGSMAWVDDLERLRVGPSSAGAEPGPVAYGKGGVSATTTDANLALGRINPGYFCGGDIDADMDAVTAALDRLAGPLAMDRAEVARGIVRMANNNMVNALKLVSVNRGHDPRDFTMIAFGGGGGLHGAALAAELGVGKVVVPAAAAVFSAWAMLMSDLRRDLLATLLVDLEDGALETINARLEELRTDARDRFTAEGFAADSVTFQHAARLRYRNQEHSVEVPLGSGTINAESRATLAERFHGAYEKEYTYRLAAPVEMVGLHIVATVPIGHLEPAPATVTGRGLAEAVKGIRSVDYALEGVHAATIYDGPALEPGMAFQGPAIVEDAGTITLIHPAHAASVDDWGNIHIAITAQEAPS